MLMGAKLKELEKIPALTAEEERWGHKIVDKLAKDKNISNEPDPKRRRRARDSIVYGMTMHGDYHPVHAVSFMKMWQIRNNVDADEPPVYV